MKLFGKIVFYIVAGILILLLCAELAMRFILPLNIVKEKIISIASAQTHSDVKIQGITAGILGITLSDISLVTDQQQLVGIEEVYVRFNPFALLVGKVRVDTIIIDGLNLKLLRNKDGSFNFDTLLNSFQTLPQPKPADSKPEPSPFDLFVRVIQIKNSVVSFDDATTNLNLKLNDMFLEVFRFTFDKPFSVSTHMSLNAVLNGKELVTLPFGFTVYPNLEGMDFKKAYVDLKLFVAQMQKASFVVQGNAENFENPYMTISATASDISSAMLSNIIALPEFNIPLVRLDTKISADINASKINIDSFNVSALSSTIAASGYVSYGGVLAYNINVTANSMLDKVAAAAPIAQAYKPSGTVDAVINITDQVISGNITVSDFGGYLEQAGTLSKINTKIIIKDINDISVPSITGRLNGYSFKASLNYKMFKEFADIAMSLKAEKVLLKFSEAFLAMIESQPEPQGATVAPATSEPAKPMDWPLPPLNIKADISINNFDSPLFAASDIKFKTDVRNVTPALDKTSGKMSLSTAEGEIKDLYRLTNANAVTKVLFLSLGIVSKVVNSLNVLDVLSTIETAVANTVTGGPEAPAITQEGFEPGEELVAPEEPKKIEGKLDYATFVTALDFTDGRTDIDKCFFVSGMLSFKVKGDMDFNTRKLHMTVNAAPGRHYDDGVMPLTLAIGGTIDSPTGSMSVLSSVASLVTQSLLKNPASALLKKGLGGIFGIVGLDGKDKKEEEHLAEQEAQSAQQGDSFIPLQPVTEPVALDTSSSEGADMSSDTARTIDSVENIVAPSSPSENPIAAQVEPVQ